MSAFYSPAPPWRDDKDDKEDYEIWVKAAKDCRLDNPFEAKCLYVFGTIRHLMYAANKLYPKSEKDADHSLPACIIGFNVIELLGRCLRGDTEHRDKHDKRIKCGLRYIAELEPDSTKNLYISETTSYDVPSKILVKIRNFTAHGLYGSDTSITIDRLLIAWLFGAIGDAIQRYYDELEKGENCEGMLQATVQPLYNDNTGKPTRIESVLPYVKSLSILPGKGTWNWTGDYEKVKRYNSKSR